MICLLAALLSSTLGSAPEQRTGTVLDTHDRDGRATVLPPHEFVFHADKSYRSVNLAGSFNGWNKGATPMKADADGRTWRVTLPVEPGEIQYKFVLDDNDWVTDPNGKSVDDGNGHMNSLLVIFPAGYDLPAREGDGTITLSALRHLQDGADVNLDRGKLTLALRARPDDVASISVLMNGSRTPLRLLSKDAIYARYSARVPWTGTGTIRYAFELNDGQSARYFGPHGMTEQESGNDYELDGRTYHAPAPPAWLERTVIYQIFPDRFANGDRRNDPAGVRGWDAVPKGSDYFGGDVAGVRQHLEYLHDLGVNAVFFNPIFKSPVSHRYETSDYLQVDPRFGTNEEFFGLTKAMKARGIRTILDGVFNHSATDLFAFSDVLRSQRRSRFLKWYTVKSFPVAVRENPPYLAWWNYPSMPKMNVLNPETGHYLLSAVDYWQRHAEIAGWRLDAANEVPMEFWRQFRRTVKGIDPNAWILGEEWGDASAWLKGDQWDASMNYPFREAVLKFVSSTGNGKPSDLLSGLMRVYSMYPPQISRNQMNLIGSHDTPRILTLCGGDKGLAKLAAVLQMTWVGVPSIYYGDELGMEGGADPDNRRGMDWSRASAGNDLLRLYRRLVALRGSHPELQSGDPVPVASDDARGTAVYGRVLDGKVAFVVVNRSGAAQTVEADLPSELSGLGGKHLTDALGDSSATISSSGHFQVQVPAKGAAIFFASPTPLLNKSVLIPASSHRRSHA